MTLPTNLDEVIKLIENSDVYRAIESKISINTPPSGNGALRRNHAEDFMQIAYNALAGAEIDCKFHSFDDAFGKLLNVQSSGSWTPYENSPIWDARRPFVQCMVAANLVEGGIDSEEGRAIIGVLANYFNQAYGQYGVNITAIDLDRDYTHKLDEKQYAERSAQHEAKIVVDPKVTETLTKRYSAQINKLQGVYNSLDEVCKGMGPEGPAVFYTRQALLVLRNDREASINATESATSVEDHVTEAVRFLEEASDIIRVAITNRTDRGDSEDVINALNSSLNQLEGNPRVAGSAGIIASLKNGRDRTKH